MNALENFNQQTMSSREIAELTGKRHDHVLRDCDVLNESYSKLGLPKIGESFSIRDLPNGGKASDRYFQLSKIQTFDLMTGYNVELRIKVNRRWEELETKQLASIAPRNLKEALILALKLEEEKEQLALELSEQKPFVTAFNRVIDNATTYTLDTVSDIVNVGRTKLSEMLKTINWAVKDSTKGTASTRYAEEHGYAKTIFDTLVINGKEKPLKKIAITRKGLDKLVVILNQ